MTEKTATIQEPKRPSIKDFDNLGSMHQSFLNSPKLYNYIRALDNYIDELESYALSKSREAFEAGREVVVDMAEDWELYKYQTFEDYLNSKP